VKWLLFWKELELNFQLSPFFLSRLLGVFWVGFTILHLPFFRYYLYSKDGAAGVSHLFSSNYSGFIYWCRLLKTDLKTFLGGLVYLKMFLNMLCFSFPMCRFSFLLLFGGVVFERFLPGCFYFRNFYWKLF